MASLAGTCSFLAIRALFGPGYRLLHAQLFSRHQLHLCLNLRQDGFIFAVWRCLTEEKIVVGLNLEFSKILIGKKFIQTSFEVFLIDLPGTTLWLFLYPR